MPPPEADPVHRRTPDGGSRDAPGTAESGRRAPPREPGTPAPGDRRRGPRPEALLGALTLALLVAIGVAAEWRIAAPPARHAAADGSFSADRAMATLETILRDGAPHPVGSAANAQVRTRIVHELRSLGLDPQVTSSVACSDAGTCAQVHNIVTSLPATAPPPRPPEAQALPARPEPRGERDASAVLPARPEQRRSAIILLSHHDSVPAASGANDDGVGVAVTIETLRALLANPAPRMREVLAVMTDGEEEGLIGARAFALHDPRARRAELALNVEARGSAGPSMMFETGAGSGELVRLYGRHCRRPIASSVFASIYDRMPNDTDFSVMKRSGLPGLNFAHVGQVEHYHTPRDELRNVSRDTLAHHGQCLLALSRALVAQPAPLPRHELVYFDLLGFGLLRWPSPWTLPLGLLAGLSCLAAALRLGRSHAGAGVGAFVRSSVALPLIALACAATGHAVVTALRAASGAAAPWTAHPLAPTLAVLAAACAAGLLVAAWLVRRTPPSLLWLGVWLPLAGIALALATRQPSLSPPLLVPSLAAGLAYWLCGAPRTSGTALAIASLLGAAATGLVLLPWTVAGRDSLGLAASPIVTLPVALCIAAALPGVAALGRRAQRAWIGTSAGIAVLALGASLLAPAYDREHPRALSLQLVQAAEGGPAHWFTDAAGGALPAGLAAFGFGPPVEPRPASLRGNGPVFVAEAEPADLASPEVELLSVAHDGARQTIALRVRSQRGAHHVGVLIPSELALEWIEMDGYRSHPITARWVDRSDRFSRHTYASAQPEGVVFRIALADRGEPASPSARTTGAEGPERSGQSGQARESERRGGTATAHTISLIAFDRSSGLAGAGPNAQALLRARPDWAVPRGHGDGIVATRRIEIAR